MVLTSIWLLPFLVAAFAAMGVVAVASQFLLRFSTARTDGKSARRALVEAAKQVPKDNHSNASVDGAQASATSADNSIPTRDPGTTISRPAVSDSEQDCLASSAPSSTKDSLKQPDSELEAVYLSPVASPLAITLASSTPAPEPQQEASPHTTHDVDVYGAILHMFESCPELPEDIQEVVETEEGAAEQGEQHMDAVPSAAATESAAVESADASPEAVSSSGQDGLCVVKVVLPDLCKDAGLVPLGSGSSLSSGFPSSPAGTASSCSSSPAGTAASCTSSPAGAASSCTSSPAAPGCPEQLPSSSLPEAPTAPAAAAQEASSVRHHTGESSMGPGSQAAMEGVWLLPAGLISAGGSSVAGGGVVDASPSSSSSSLPAAPAAAASYLQTISHHPQQLERQELQVLQQLQCLLPEVTALHKLSGADPTLGMLRGTTVRCGPLIRQLAQAGGLSGRFTPFYVPDMAPPLAEGAFGTVRPGRIYSSYGIVAAVTKTAARPDSDTQNSSLILEGRLMLTLQQEGRVDSGCTVRALALCVEAHPVSGGPEVTLVLERARCSLREELADATLGRQLGYASRPVLPLPRALLVLRTVVTALVATHGRGFVHQDVKPDNILVREDGSVALGDFGLAAEVSADGTYEAVASGGTPHFGAPEVALVRPALDGGVPWTFVDLCRAAGLPLSLTRGVDIWSLGVLAVCLMVTGNDSEAAARYARGELALPAYVPAALAQLIGDCTIGEPEQRPSAEEALQRIAGMEQQFMVEASQHPAAVAGPLAVAAQAAAAEAAAEMAMGELAEGMMAMLDF
ncbi:hypothetical protein HYH02_002891 [Chlamydomonas schloesseri]|uniref:Protein kinase domain-containing protein n=1 Tax=Chlamydomonas schloesseri TaxID=2026947 RepID=A0A835WSU5_9CHLO|nr:hypothetical protein HYH02_002891 [Chlamydomonas schloesseri]|eukprot:KAG2452658.1 hypothetical protein HYH02_002891 [Chlamydomonas schloesseri]